jgi:hypothetical protein
MRKFILAGIVLLSGSVAAFAEPPQINPAFRFNAENPNFSGRNKNWIMDPKSNCWVFDGNPAPNETLEWSGACEDKLATGEGTVTFFKNGQPRLILSGKFSRGSLTGPGKELEGGGITREGEFQFSVPYGYGVITRPNGEQYRGEWPGNGTYSLPDGTSCPTIVRRAQRFFLLEGSCVPKDLGKTTPAQAK